MSYQVFYTSDLHGNKIQYQKLLELAIDQKPRAVILGGDLLPKGLPLAEYIQAQHRFIEKDLHSFGKKLKKNAKQTTLFVMLGNDDCVANLDVLVEHDPALYHIIHNTRCSLEKGYEIIGYPYVPMTPYKLKDWEKYDLSDVPNSFEVDYVLRKMSNYRRSGYRTVGLKWIPFEFHPKTEFFDSIQKDLFNPAFRKNPKKTIYVMHAPPHMTDLDMVRYDKHVGSFAMRQFIERFQPYLTLHGHIHESVSISGRFTHPIGNTMCMASGNDNKIDDLAVLVFDLYDVGNAKRIII
jgi:uncharacterized protein